MTAEEPRYRGVRPHLLEVHDRASASIEQSMALYAPRFGRLLQQEADISEWEKMLTKPVADVLERARRELGFAVYCAAGGLYLQAWSTLRVVLELSFAAVHFSTNDLARRAWLSDREQFRWSSVLDAKTGVLSPQFVSDYHAEAAAEAGEYLGRARACYAQCSKFIHGRPDTEEVLPRSLTFSQPAIEEWCKQAEHGVEAVLFALYCRFAEELPSQDGRLEVTLESSFRHLASVRRTLGMPVESRSDRGQ